MANPSLVHFPPEWRKRIEALARDIVTRVNASTYHRNAESEAYITERIMVLTDEFTHETVAQMTGIENATLNELMELMALLSIKSIGSE